MKLRCDQIEATDATQVRTKLSKEAIDDYCEAIKNGAQMPPVDVYAEKGSKRYIMADGFHRLYGTVLPFAAATRFRGEPSPQPQKASDDPKNANSNQPVGGKAVRPLHAQYLGLSMRS